ncbi:MAG: RdgB/HAM1 family non-canonical purine NTP pyrophosphatase [Methylotenera sp.]|uniref:RdgB/HAM1 family non-canonical purine NTP pyrophosphatase n=1 Tax=Methylotenera sp. TaxID=2051956 RepID=UPI00271A66DF|nr:RdgB/HAM1 family non-canonical purine NTP pyrophosphatase [Methylotenera sp.]MDO9205282.1 RdgB/HAM1 family non-canonical purine NTP pyrophosphatase [Methylotenera sp.]MDO9393366.1 RdgB/HAM1 family non-canonical purine NTP pyrophosphatase [Methylotenera sp.]MDP1522921.1 RdgB/HAM1 family non-canonical purine NTP pyrophosphatase [Methylotenera sp.]MDP3817840.1 RdgB/HAM1 family non-canonical purine NTP pyrophosphatase [Methylotenera sp.]MDZ4213001.1 RdgB/HAM1 family non-canonical purine NTP pyr
MFNKLVIASGNKGKLREIQHILSPLQIEIIPQSALNVPECEEPFCTFIENALAKARHASKHTGLPALADDSGLCVDALQGGPGVLSARFAGEPKSDENNNQKLLEVMTNEKNRHAHFYCVMVLVQHEHDPEPLIAEGLWAGEILTEYRGTDGFGYDPLFLDAKTGKTVAELPLEIKSRISHRGHAMTKLLQKLERLSHE